MYPGTATRKEINPFNTIALAFKSTQREKFAAKRPVEFPATNICETASEYRISLAVPGLHKEDFCIGINDGVLSISVKNEITKNCCTIDRSEYDYSEWTRAFILPVDADAVLASAKYQRGELQIRMPRGNTNGSKSFSKVYVY